MTLFEWIQTGTSIVTAVGVGIAAWQLYLNKQQTQAQFEDSFAEQYRKVSSQLPLDALLGKTFSESDLQSSLHLFYEYFDLWLEWGLEWGSDQVKWLIPLKILVKKCRILSLE